MSDVAEFKLREEFLMEPPPKPEKVAPKPDNPPSQDEVDLKKTGEKRIQYVYSELQKNTSLFSKVMKRVTQEEIKIRKSASVVAIRSVPDLRDSIATSGKYFSNKVSKH